MKCKEFLSCVDHFLFLNVFFLWFSENQSELFNSTQHTVKKLNINSTDLRQKYEENVKELARLQKEKAEISENFELTQDRLQDIQREMREMRSEYDNKLLDSQQPTQDTVIECGRTQIGCMYLLRWQTS